MSAKPTERTATKPPVRRGRATQLELRRTAGWGGKRRGAGRKRRPGVRSRVVHAKRPSHKGRHPVHATLRAAPGLASFRDPKIHAMFASVLRDQRKRRYKDEFRVVHFSIQSNHLHLIVEADTERSRELGYDALRSGLAGLAIAFARRLNMMLGRTGKVWADRYHRHDLKTPRETWSALGYVFENYKHHGEFTYGDGVVDGHSSAWLFDGWSGPHTIFLEPDRWKWPVCPAKTWLVRRGHARIGPLHIAPRHCPTYEPTVSAA